MKKTIITVIEEILDGKISLNDGAFRLDISPSEMKNLIRTYSIQGADHVSEGLLSTLKMGIINSFEGMKIQLRSYPEFRRMKMKLAYSMVSFLIVSVGIVMFTMSASVFPDFMFAADSSGDFYQARLTSNMNFKTPKSVNRQLKKAGSIYDRMERILKANPSSSNKKLMDLINKRKKNLTKIKTAYIKHGNNIAQNPRLKMKDGEIYERMLDSFPPESIKSGDKFAGLVLERVQKCGTKLAKVKNFYRSSLKKKKNHYAKIIKKIDSSETKTVAQVKKVKKTAVPRIVKPVKKMDRVALEKKCADIYKRYRARRMRRAKTARRYKPMSKMPVISRFNKSNQIIRTLGKKQAQIMTLETARM
jgi:ElaB/YqjD/DUF883 family membrane-anchored ribosome-binding protein